MGIRATGEYENSLSLEVSDAKMIIRHAIYGRVIDNGRAPGGKPGIPSIIRWIENKKGLPPSMLRDKKRVAYAIANKIAKEGIKVPNQYNPGKLITTVVDEFLAKDMYNLLTEIQQYQKQQIEYSMLQVFKAS